MVPLRTWFGALAVIFLLFGPGVSAQSLTVAGDRFVVDGKPTYLIFASYFDALHRANAGEQNPLARDMAFLRSRVNGIRIFPNFWDGCDANAGCRHARPAADTLFTAAGQIQDAAHWSGHGLDPWTRYIAVLQAANDAGLLVEVAFSIETTPGITFERYRSALEAVVRRLGQSNPELTSHIFYDVANEFTKNLPDPKYSNAASLIDAVLKASSTAIVTASIEGSGAREAGMNAVKYRFPVVAFHDPRVRNWYEDATIASSIAAIRSGMGAAVKPIIFDEPQRWQADPVAAHFTSAADAARRSGVALWVFHSWSSFGMSAQPMADQMSANEMAALSGLFKSIRNVSPPFR